MKQSFTKTIEGHEIEFVRLMYPTRYELFCRIANSNPFKIAVEKDTNEAWNISSTAELPGWFNEITLSVIEAIEENERDSSDQ